MLCRYLLLYSFLMNAVKISIGPQFFMPREQQPIILKSILLSLAQLTILSGCRTNKHLQCESITMGKIHKSLVNISTLLNLRFSFYFGQFSIFPLFGFHARLFRNQASIIIQLPAHLFSSSNLRIARLIISSFIHCPGTNVLKLSILVVWPITL